jgi:hypothetical protein
MKNIIILSIAVVSAVSAFAFDGDGGYVAPVKRRDYLAKFEPITETVSVTNVVVTQEWKSPWSCTFQTNQNVQIVTVTNGVHMTLLSK